MNLKQLLFAKSVAETRSFSKAAEICHATQPTLSNAISLLEEELGGKLFVRTTRKVELTAFGEYLLPFVGVVLTHRQELEKAAHVYHNPEHKLLRIGLSPLINMKLLVQALTPYRQAHPTVTVFFKECLLNDLDERLLKGQIDFAVIPAHLKAEERQTHFFYEEPLYYLPQQTDGVQDIRQFKINELPDAPIILTGGGCGLNGALAKIFKKERFELKSYLGQALSYRVIEEWVALGIGAGILPSAKISPDNKTARPLFLHNGKPATFSYQWTWYNGLQAGKEISEFIEYLATIDCRV